MIQPSASSTTAPLELPRGLALNSFRVICPGTHRLTRLPRPASKEARSNLERSLGQVLFLKEEFAYAAAATASIPDSIALDLECNFDRALHLFDLRSCISAQASRKGFDVRFRRGGEINITGLPGDIQIDGLVVQRRLRLRVVEEGSVDLETWIVGRHDTRWLVVGSLSDTEVRDRAIGEMAERIGGTGPARGEVVSVTNEVVTLRVGSEEVTAISSNYTLTVHSGYVRRYYHPDTMTKLQVISNALTPTGQRNRYAVKDRYKAFADDMEQLGWTILMPVDRKAIIERAWTEIRIQAVGG